MVVTYRSGNLVVESEHHFMRLVCVSCWSLVARVCEVMFHATAL